MDPPQFLLDALTDSITSGTFVDTKLYVFSRRERSGRVGSPRALYCNSRVLNTVPYLSACGYRKLIRCYASDSTVWKCSQMSYQKNKRGISTGDSRPTPSLTQMIMSICPTVTSKMGPPVLRRKIKNLPRMAAPNFRAIFETQSRKYHSPRPRGVCHGHHRMEVTFKVTTSEPRCPPNCLTAPANSYSQTRKSSDEDGKGCHHPRRGSGNVCEVCR